MNAIILGWDEDGNEKAIPTNAEANETIDRIAKNAGLHVWLPLPAEDAVTFANDILAKAQGPRPATPNAVYERNRREALRRFVGGEGATRGDHTLGNANRLRVLHLTLAELAIERLEAGARPELVEPIDEAERWTRDEIASATLALEHRMQEESA